MTKPSDDTFKSGATRHSECGCCEHAAREVRRLNQELLTHVGHKMEARRAVSAAKSAGLTHNKGSEA